MAHRDLKPENILCESADKVSRPYAWLKGQHVWLRVISHYQFSFGKGILFE